MIPARQPLSRRTALAAGLGAAGLLAAGASGCRVQLPGNGSATPTPRPVPGALEPDVQIVVDLVNALRRSIALLQAALASHPRLATRLTPMLTVQRAHLEVLRKAAPAHSLTKRQPAAVDAPASAAQALSAVLAHTRTLHDQYNAFAGGAESGKFARLLAGMGAALSQRLAAIKAAAPAHEAGRIGPLGATGTSSLQDTLAGEHAAVYVFGVLAAQTSEADQPRLWADLDTAYEWHRAARDDLVAGITTARQTPVAASPSYQLPNAAGNADQVVRAALVTERRVTDTYGTLVAETAGGVRRWAIGSLDQSAVRQLRFRGRPEIFPGTGGLSGQR